MLYVQIHSPLWKAEKTAKQAVRNAYKLLKQQKLIQPKESLTVALDCDLALQTLNKTYRAKDAPTNVLSFPSTQENYLGDIAIAFETMSRESIEQEKSFEQHLTHIALHGMLHLLGYDHEQENDAEEMEALEVELLKMLEIENPYL
jgi:probable rRNA maturation factor